MRAFPGGNAFPNDKQHLKCRQSWLENLFHDLFDLLGGKAMQIRIGGKIKKTREFQVDVTADGSFPEDYSI